MIPVSIATAMKVDTNPMVHPSLSMKNLHIIISTVPGLFPPRHKPGAVGLLGVYPPMNSMFEAITFTLVNSVAVKKIGYPFMVPYRYIALILSMIGREPGPANTSGKDRGSALPSPAGTAAQVFYRRSIPDTASMEKCRALRPAGRWSAFPAALLCKAQTAISY